MWDESEVPEGTIEGKQIIRGGKVVGGMYRWHTGRVSATIDRGQVSFARHSGKFASLQITVLELVALESAAAWWAHERETESWYVYDIRWAGPGRGGEQYVHAPQERGRGSTSCAGFKHTARLAPVPPEPVAPGVSRVGTVWHPGEDVGPKGGALVGVALRIGELSAWALGHELRVWRGSPEAMPGWEPGNEPRMVFEDGEEDFLRELVALRGQTKGGR